MARDEARIFTAIWQDDHFLSLSPDEQRLYLFLLSQPDLSYCGVIALRERRWSKKARGLTVEQISEALAALAANPSGNPSLNPSGSPVSGPLVVVDEDAEEVFVRSLIRLDGIWKQPNLLKAAREAARLIQSPQIRRALVAELRRIPVEKSESAHVKKVMAEFIAEFAEDSGDPFEDVREETANPSPNPSGNPSADPSQGKGEGYGEYVVDSPIPGIPSPVPPSAGAVAPRAADVVPISGEQTVTQRSKRITDAYHAVEPLCKWPAVNAIVIKAIKAGKWPDSEIQDALLRLAGDNRGVTVETLRRELSPPAPPQGRNSPAPSRNAQIIDAAMERAKAAEQRMAEEAQFPRGAIAP